MQPRYAGIKLGVILQSWASFLHNMLGAPRDGAVSQLIKMILEGSSYEQIMKRIPLLKRVADNPDVYRGPAFNHSEMVTISDEELVASTATRDRNYGFNVCVPNLVVFMRELLPYVAGVKRVVDIGSGPSSYTTFLKSQGILTASVKACDPSAAMHERAKEIMDRRKVKGTELVQAWGHQLPVEDGYADLTLIIDSLHWMERWRDTLREAARVTADEARIFIVYSLACPRRKPESTEVTRILAGSGMDVEKLVFFGGEASDTPRVLIVAVKRKPRGIIVPGKIGY